MIDSFTGVYRFLSNFYPVGVVLDGYIYHSVEHAYQAAKTLDKQERLKFFGIKATEAKKLGKKVTLRPDWEEVKDSIMFELLQQKFEKGELRYLLAGTGTQEIIEGNWWGDTYWGVCKGVGQNKLGKLLMQVRSSI